VVTLNQHERCHCEEAKPTRQSTAFINWIATPLAARDAALSGQVPQPDQKNAPRFQDGEM
jgi:hypothetical protein